jgi:hypothetical protein
VEDILLAVVGLNDLWFAMPLVVALSLVYAATRHELMVPILTHAVRIGLWIVVFMVVIFLILLLLSWWL